MNAPRPADCQAELNLRLRAAGAVNADAIAELCGLLRGRGWVTRRELQALRPAWTERFIRAVADASEGAVLSAPGTQGYCLTVEAPLDEIDHAAASLASQGRKMLERSVVFARVAGLRRAEAHLLSVP